MALAPPSFVKFRRESEFGLVYEHENYGYEDANLLRVDERVVDVLERTADSPQPREELAGEFSPELVETLLQRGLLTDV
jgi:putative mycofactocin binding protein MftB